jgi:hypothetical protein
VSASSTFAQLISEVAKTYVGSKRDPVDWIVDVQPGSVRLPLRGRPTTDKLDPSAIREIASVIAGGIETLDARSERPPCFSDRAVQLTKALANLATDDVPISVRNGQTRIPLSTRVVANADALLGPVLASYGTIEGRLEALNIHGPRPAFAIFEPLTGHRVECYFGERVELAEVTAAIGKRVGARGRIKTRRNGERVSVEVDELRVLRDADELPPASAARGLLRAAG